MENRENEYLWNMYNNAGLESITSRQLMQNTINWSITSASLILALCIFIADTDFLNNKASIIYVTYAEWITNVALGILGSSQYVGEFGHMLRSGCYSRKLEKLTTQNLFEHSVSIVSWEQYLETNRFYSPYLFSSISATFGMVATQFLPFFIYNEISNVSSIKLLGFNINIYYLLLPCISATITLIIPISLAVFYIKKYEGKPD